MSDTQAAERLRRYNVWGMETAEDEQGDFVKYVDHVRALTDAERRGRDEERAQCVKELEWIADGYADIDDLNKPFAEVLRESALTIATRKAQQEAPHG
jgi:hypothetical protein